VTPKARYRARITPPSLFVPPPYPIDGSLLSSLVQGRLGSPYFCGETCPRARRTSSLRSSPSALGVEEEPKQKTNGIPPDPLSNDPETWPK